MFTSIHASATQGGTGRRRRSLVWGKAGGGSGGHALDLFMGDFDSELFLEQLEQSFMAHSETESKHILALNSLHTELRDVQAREKNMKKSLDEENEKHKLTQVLLNQMR